jgi:hypothetical protein
MDLPMFSANLAPTDFHLFPTVMENTCQETVSPVVSHQMCYHYVADTTWTQYTRWQVPQSSIRLEKYYTGDTFNVYCQFPLIKSCLWYKGNVNLRSDPHSYCTCVSFSTEICTKFWTWTALSQTGCNRSWTSTAPSHEWNILLLVHILLLSWKV